MDKNFLSFGLVMDLKKLERILTVLTVLVLVIDVFFESLVPKKHFSIFVAIMIVIIVANITVLIFNRSGK